LTKWYPADDMPSDEQLLHDAAAFAAYLKLVYDAEVLGLAPTAPPPEIIEVERAASGQPQHSKTQGFGLSVAERRAVELRAMALAKSHLQKLGWHVRDVSATHPYDFECTRGDQKLIVEVKGTTSTGDEVVVTRNEVEVQRTRHPNNALIVVHSVDLVRSAGAPKADAGTLLMRSPWNIEDSHLRPIAFRCAVQREERDQKEPG
jgi:Protein NO VEIN, C-terminal